MARLNAWLDRSGLTRVALAESLGISRPHLSGLMLGRRTPSLALALRIAAVTGIPTDAWSQQDGAAA